MAKYDRVFSDLEYLGFFLAFDFLSVLRGDHSFFYHRHNGQQPPTS